MTIKLERNLCCDLNETIAHEWLVTNGLGGYAAGTVAGVLTRGQHGLLVAPPPNAESPQLFLAKIDEEVVFDQRTYYLGTNEYRDGTFNPAGFVHLETFRVEAGFPVFTYRVGGINGVLLEKRIWMAQGQNTTYIQYRVIAQSIGEGQEGKRPDNNTTRPRYGPAKRSHAVIHTPLELTLLPFTACRPVHETQHGNASDQFCVHTYKTGICSQANTDSHLPPGVAGCTIQADAQTHPYYLLATGAPGNQTTFIPTGVWYWNFLKRHEVEEARRTEDLYLPGVIRTTLWTDRDSELTLVASMEELTPQSYSCEQIQSLYQENVHYKEQYATRHLATIEHLTAEEQPGESSPIPKQTQEKETALTENDCLRYLLYSYNHFLTTMHAKQLDNQSTPFAEQYKRTSSERSEQKKPTLAWYTDYFDLESRTRDILIALPTILMVEDQQERIRTYMHELAAQAKRGILPEQGDMHMCTGGYYSADLPLWYCHTLDCYLNATQDWALLEELFPTLASWIHSYMQGTAKIVAVDPSDSLFIVKNDGQAHTWMNAYKNGAPVTPRAGKPVEINALWYQTLRLMGEWSERIGPRTYLKIPLYPYREIAENCRRHFQQRFWWSEKGYLRDVVDGFHGDSGTLSVNQLLAISLRYPVLDEEYRQSVLESIERHLLTPYGLRTIAPEEPEYHGSLLVAQNKKGVEIEQGALHQGAIWTWLIGPYVDALIQEQERSGDKGTWQQIQRSKERLLAMLRKRLPTTLIGSCEGIFPGDMQEDEAKEYQPELQLSSLGASTELLRAYIRLNSVRVVESKGLLTH